MQMRHVVFGTHEYQWALRPFAYLFGKYWGPQRVLYVGDRLAGQLPDNVEFMRVPCYTEGIWPWKEWFSNGVKETLKVLEDDIVAVFLPDHWVCKPVRHDVVDAMAGYMREEGNVVRGNLTGDTSLQGHSEVVATRGDVEIIICADRRHCGKEAGTALSPALWNRKLFMEILEPHWGLWATEQLGTEKMHRERPGWVSVGTNPGALERVNGLRSGKRKEAAGLPQKEVWLGEFAEEDGRVVRGMVPGRYDVVG